MKSNLLRLNDNPKWLQIFEKTPLYTWHNVDYKFAPKRRIINEYYCKTQQPLVGSTISLEPIESNLLYGEIFTLVCSGIDIGFSIKIPSTLKVNILGESMIMRPTLLDSEGTNIKINLSLPNIQVFIRDDTTQFVVVNNPNLKVQND